MKKSNNVKKRVWTFEIYPSQDYINSVCPDCLYDGSSGYGLAPDNFVEILNKSGLSGSISPLHCFDQNPDGTYKKPHYHVILVYGNTTTFSSVKTFVLENFHSPIPQPLESVRGMYRYFTHKDNPEKYQYSDNDIINFGGFNIVDYIELTKSEVDKILFDLTYIIRDNFILEYSDLIFYCLEHDLMDYFSVASRNTIYFNTLISSIRNRNNNKSDSYKL